MKTKVQFKFRQWIKEYKTVGCWQLAILPRLDIFYGGAFLIEIAWLGWAIEMWISKNKIA